ncbi:MAG: ubiquinone biosynthesis protein UbiJ [Pseudohongiellaceae bacterium]|jgi:ubiquinone biosynthesis protein UbiJ
MFKPLLTSAVTWPFERLINSVIRSDQHAVSNLRQFQGKQIEIETVSPQFNLCIVFIDSEVRLSPFSSQELVSLSDAKVGGDASTLLGLLTAKTEDRPLANPRLTISGDAQLVQSAFKLLHSLDMRWDDWLSSFVGSVATHSLKTSADDIKRWSEDSAKAFKHDVDQYLKQETNILPCATHIEEFQERLEALRLRIDRVTARAQRLQTLTAAA